jgi:transcriptional regulator with PAS, ATPase and Fis domain
MLDALSILHKIENPVILFHENGAIHYMNEKARHLLKTFKLAEPDSAQIRDIDPSFDKSACLAQGHVSKTIGAAIDIRVDIYAFMGNSEPTFLYLFEDRIFLSERFKNIIDCIDDAIVIVNGKGQFEFANRAMFRGNEDIAEYEVFNADKHIGEDFQKLLSDYGIAYQSLIPPILQTKEIMSKNITYTSRVNSIIRTVTGAPLLDDEENIEQIIFTTRDISRIVELEIKLSEIEKYKHAYFNQLEELNKYRSQHRLIYSSTVMEKLLGVASKVAGTDSAVFITGESGVGKEEFAKYIHANSKRKDMPFIAINCAAIPSELMESELFGYERGAFTGAKQTGKKGIFDEGNGGTIFLDEIGEMPRPLQTKLLRVIQEGCFMRVGGSVPIKLNARYISATNLGDEELKEKLRQDLYYRLNTISMRIPPLRERRDDIVPLSFHFLSLFNENYRKNIKISKNVMRMLLNRQWPGNVRELRNTIERLVILADSDMVDTVEFDDIMGLDSPDNTEETVQVKGIIPLSEAYQRVEQLLIESTYGKCGSIVETARILGITPSTIYRKIKEGTLVLNKQN